MAVKRVSADDFEIAISATLNEFKDATYDILQRAVVDVAKNTVKSIKANIKNKGLVKSGEYLKSWKYKEFDDRIAPKTVVYSTKPQLPHLIEFGHMTRSGGRTGSFEHLQPAMKEAADLLPQKIKELMESDT